MFNNTFYPTPNSTIELMLEPYIGEYTDPRWNDTRKYLRGLGNYQILDPSAGKGNILDYLRDTYRMEKRNLYAIEIEPELQMILQSKDYKVIDSDFLAYDGRYLFDLILMNPPFDNGVKHLLKAWQILVNGEIVCLLNAETINNPYSKERQLLTNIIEVNGTVEHIGKVFADAERHTDVNVVIVRLKKVTPELDIDFDNNEFDQDNQVIDEEFIKNPLQKADMINSIVDQYNKAVELTIAKRQLNKEYIFYLQGVKSFSEETSRSLNEELSNLKELFWQYLFNRTKLGQETTSNFQEKLEKFRTSAINMSFNCNNILSIFDIFVQTKDENMKECTWSVFSRATNYHKKNKVWVEGWKSNSSYRINKKIIIPHGGIRFDPFGNFELSYYRSDFFNDLDKVICYQQGKRITDIDTIEGTLRKRFNELKKGGDYRQPIFSTFFEIRFFKKSTVHLFFLDDHVWETLNVSVSKNWLPGDDFS